MGTSREIHSEAMEAVRHWHEGVTKLEKGDFNGSVVCAISEIMILLGNILHELRDLNRGER